LVFDAKGGEIWRSDVIFRGSSPLCMHLEILHCTCMFNFSYAWTLVGLWLDCNNLWVFMDCDVVENKNLWLPMWWSMVVISNCLSYGLF
jgi:hypothetical protein